MKFKLFARLKKKSKDEKNKKNTSPENVSNQAKKEDKYNTAIPQPNAMNKNLNEEIGVLFNQGLSEEDIIKDLKQKGYSFDQIDSAMNNLLDGNTDNVQNNTVPQEMPVYSNDPLLSNVSPQQNVNVKPYVEEGLNIEEVEEIVNEMISAKLNDLFNFKEKSIKEVGDNSKKLSSIESTIEEIKKDLDLFKKNYEKETTGLKDKVEDFVSRIESIEKAFKEVIPNIVDEQRGIKAEFDDIEKKLQLQLQNNKK